MTGAAQDLRAAFIGLRPAGGFGLIMADPPWPTEMRSEKGYAKSPEAQYATMTLAAIEAMPVGILAARDSLLWLWARGIQLREAIAVCDAWGFDLKTSGHWVKTTKNGKLQFGTGYILRNAGDPWLIATRGAPRTTRVVRSVIMGLARGHSRKPDEAFREAERLMPDAQRIELFSRQNRPGWSVWGDEAGKFGCAA